MGEGGRHGSVIRTAARRDLSRLQEVYAAASLSNPGDAPLLLAHPQFLLFTGEGLATGRTRVAVTGAGRPDGRASPADGPDGGGRVLGFATVVPGRDGTPELDDLFVDPPWHRHGIARDLVADAVRIARAAGHDRMLVTANPHALAFYRSVGFVGDDRTTTSLGSGRRMALDLTAERALSGP